MIDRLALDETVRNLATRLLEQRNNGGRWRGQPSSSALSTTTAISALTLAAGDDVAPGIAWLLTTRLLEQRTGGGWWRRHLSSSALSRATAVSALTLAAGGDVTPGIACLAASQCWTFAIACSAERHRSTAECAAQ
ncbi:MAG: hypothetical protein U0Q16_38995 [Bryobacteraceae bacterium]